MKKCMSKIVMGWRKREKLIKEIKGKMEKYLENLEKNDGSDKLVKF